MSLRRASLVFAAALTIIGAGVAITLMLLTTNLRHSAHQIGTGVESLRIGEELEFGLVSLLDSPLPVARTASEELVRRQVAHAGHYVDTPEEQAIVDHLREQVERYIAALERKAVPEETRQMFDSAFAATRQWIQLSVGQSRDIERLAERWEHVADLVGVGAILLLVVGLGGLALWLQRMTFRPALKLVRTIDEYTRGERTARASEQGPEEFRTIAHQFNDMAAVLEHQRAGQLAFLAGVAHDIRNPLAALKLATAMIAPDEPLPPEPRVRQLLARITRQIDRLERMVYDFIDAARIESGNLELHVEACDVRNLARTTLDLFEPATRTHKLVATLPDEPVSVTCDPMRIEQVLGNLVSNAIKYSPRGGAVQLTITRATGEVVIAVADHGIGMSADEIAHVFEPFHRVGASIGSVSGVGLGLFIARRIIDAHGGRIAIDSTPGAGSTFSVHLPESVSWPTS